MMKRVLGFLFCVVIAGCASQQDLNTLKTEIDTLNVRIVKLEADLAEQDRLLDQSLARQAEQHVNYSDFYTQMQALQGRMDELETAVRASGPGGDGGSQVSQGAMATDRPVKSSYEIGLDLFRSRDFSNALASFERYLEGDHDQSLEDNAHFWIGEALYSMERFEDAVLKYDLVIKKYPGSDKVPAALLKQGMCFIKMGDNETGRIILKKLIKDHPASDDAVKAGKLLGGN